MNPLDGTPGFSGKTPHEVREDRQAQEMQNRLKARIQVSTIFPDYLARAGLKNDTGNNVITDSEGRQLDIVTPEIPTVVEFNLPITKMGDEPVVGFLFKAGISEKERSQFLLLPDGSVYPVKVPEKDDSLNNINSITISRVSLPHPNTKRRYPLWKNALTSSAATRSDYVTLSSSQGLNGEPSIEITRLTNTVDVAKAELLSDKLTRQIIEVNPVT